MRQFHIHRIILLFIFISSVSDMTPMSAPSYKSFKQIFIFKLQVGSLPRKYPFLLMRQTSSDFYLVGGLQNTRHIQFGGAVEHQLQIKIAIAVAGDAR